MMSQLLKVVRRLRRLGARGALRRLRPRTVDELLYEVRANRQGLAPAEGFQFDRFSAGHPSGHRSIDARLVDGRRCYAFTDGGRVAHQSWLFFDTLLPGQFGFDGSVPVVGDCDTAPFYRGLGLYPLALQLIARELTSQMQIERYYILVSPANQPSIRGIEKAGGILLGRLRGVQVLGTVLRKQRVDR